jgi:hypothetical protein
MDYRKTTLNIGFLFIILSSAGCSSTPRSSEQGANQDPEIASSLVFSSVDIVYTLGRNQHRLVLMSEAEKATGKTFLDKQIVEEASLDRARYTSFLRKAQVFVTEPKRNTAQQQPCRAPYLVTLRINKEIFTKSGCRSNDEGSLSRLVKDGEFLIYSQKTATPK